MAKKPAVNRSGEPLGLRLSAETDAALRAYAAREDRTLTSVVEACVAYGLRLLDGGKIDFVAMRAETLEAPKKRAR